MENHTHFLKLLDFTPAEIQQFLDTAADLKAKKKAGIPHRYLEGKNVALIFEKTSTRTRCAFEVACQDLGMGSTYLGPTGSQIGVKESIADTATASSTGASDRKLWRSWQTTLGCRCSTASPMSSTPPRSWQTS